MTQNEKEIQRKWMLWVGVWSMNIIMVLVLWLVFLGKPINNVTSVVITYLTVMAGINASTYFSKAAPSREEIEQIREKYKNDTVINNK